MPEQVKPTSSAKEQALQSEIVRLNKIIQSLMNRSERTTSFQGSDFNLFQTAITLEAQVRRRTDELEAAWLETEKINRALRESEKRFREFSDLLPQTVAEFDLMGNVTFSNRNGFETFQYTKEDFDNGVNLAQLVIPEDHDRVNENIKKMLDVKKRTSGSPNEYTAVKKDGGLFPIAVYTSPVIRENRYVGFRAIIYRCCRAKKS